MSRFSNVVNAQIDTIAEAFEIAARRVENANRDGDAVAVTINQDGHVKIVTLPHATITEAGKEGFELIVRRFYSGPEAAPQGWADSVDWGAEAALYAQSLADWEALDYGDSQAL